MLKTRWVARAAGSTVFTLLLFIASAVLPPDPARALHAVQNEGRGTISLQAGEGVPEQASGLARFKLSEHRGGYYNMTIRFRAKSLPKRAGRVFEAWLVDSETDLRLNLGTFNTGRDGDCGFSVRRPITNLALFDRIMVTSEPRDDFDPAPNGPVVLEGKQD